jgi:3-oxoacyl-[acyl-carrier-protein] synthase-1
METNEWIDMIYKISDNIISSLGFSSQENYQAVKDGKIGLKHYENAFDVPELIVASLLDEEKLNTEFYYLPHSEKNQYTKLEKAAILSVYYALADTQIAPSDDNVSFIFSSTKGNIELLENNELYEPERIYLWRSAQLIADYFGNKNQPLVVSNACISGVAAQISAARCLSARRTKYAIVIGAEVLSKFIISGFQSFKALSNQACKPFDKNRVGLNLGEAAATIIYTIENENVPQNAIIYENGAICNDANHISGPSRTGEGLFDAITKVLKNKDINDIRFINAHGTATPYNDEMEAIAIERCDLKNIPVNSLKGYFGHTLGAAGVLETIISAHALQDNIILKSQGFEELGVTSININTKVLNSSKPSYLKLISGFGGSNAVIQLRIKNYGLFTTK